MIAEHVKLGPVGYLLSLVVNTPREKVLHVWQLAASKNGMEAGATDVLLLALRSFMRRENVRKVYFTSDPGSAQFRAIRRYAYVLFGVGLRSQQFLPHSISRNEREFVMAVK